MRIMARVLSIVMLVSMLSMPAYAEDTLTSDEMIQLFIDELVGMAEKEMYVELLELVMNLDDASGMLQAYANAFSGLSGEQQDKLSTMGLVIGNMATMSEIIIDSDFSIASLKDYLGLSDGTVNKDLLFVALKSREALFLNGIKGFNQDTIINGFEKLDKLFDYIGDLGDVIKLLPAGYLFNTTKSYGDFTVDDKAVDNIVTLLTIAKKIPNTDSTPIKLALDKLADFYNGVNSAERIALYDYFFKYSFVKVASSTATQPPTTTQPPVTIDPLITTDPLIESEDFGTDDVIPEGIALFGDIGGVTWAWTAIRQLFIADVIKGKGENTYDPDGMITRAEFAALLTRMLETSVPLDNEELEAVFVDVNKADWYYSEVMSSYEAGYISGYGNNEFKPSDNINREQIATILARVLLDRGIIELSSLEVNELLDTFTDNTEVSSWARAGSALLVKNGVVTGVVSGDEKNFMFKMNASRAEVAVMLYRVAGLIETKVTVQ